jgi:hypothetical protein
VDRGCRADQGGEVGSVTATGHLMQHILCMQRPEQAGDDAEFEGIYYVLLYSSRNV